MVCELGYRNLSRVRLPTPLPKKFKSSSKPVELDQDLLAKIGVDDPQFLAWLTSLDVFPILKEALRRTQKSIRGSASLNPSLSSDGLLECNANYASTSEKKKLEKRGDPHVAFEESVWE